MEHRPGIYAFHIPLSGDSYVGQAVDVYARRSKHLTALRAGSGARRLQAAFDACGGGLEFSVLEWWSGTALTPEEERAIDARILSPPARVRELERWLDERELHWIATLKPTLNGSTPDTPVDRTPHLACPPVAPLIAWSDSERPLGRAHPHHVGLRALVPAPATLAGKPLAHVVPDVLGVDEHAVEIEDDRFDRHAL